MAQPLRNWAALPLLALAVCCGCGDSTSRPPAGPAPAAQGSSDGWWSLVLGQVRTSGGYAVEFVHDGTGWILGKNQIQIEQVGDIEERDGKRLARFQVTVSRADESFKTTIENIECDELGIPTEQAQAKMDEAVEKIKAMLDKLQS